MEINPQVSVKKKKIGIVYDIAKTASDGRRYGWAYYLRAISLQKLCPEDMEIEIWQTGEEPWSRVKEKDLIFQIEYCNPSPRKYRGNGFNGIWCISFNSDSRRRLEYWPPVISNADFVIVNNYEAWNHYGKKRKTCCISNGYDTDIWYSTVPISERPQKLLWCGSSGPTKGKRYQETFKPLEELAPQYGFETDFRPIDDINEGVVKPYSDQREWYNSGSYILCASKSEGTPGFFAEGVLCGCVGVTVPVGNAQEWLVDGVNGIFCGHKPEDFIEALCKARENREALSAAGVETIKNGWSYGPPGDRAQYFFQLFRRLIDDGPRTIEPFSFNEKHWTEI